MHLKGWIGISAGTFTCQTVTQLELKTWFGLKECENSHTLTTTTTGLRTNKKKQQSDWQ